MKTKRTNLMKLALVFTLALPVAVMAGPYGTDFDNMPHGPYIGAGVISGDPGTVSVQPVSALGGFVPPGAAGNAACNVASLGGKTYMVGYVGDDMNAQIVRKEFAARNVDTSYVVVNPDRATNTYGKLRAGGYNIPTQEILRTDVESPIGQFFMGRKKIQIIVE